MTSTMSPCLCWLCGGEYGGEPAHQGLGDGYVGNVGFWGAESEQKEEEVGWYEDVEI